MKDDKTGKPDLSRKGRRSAKKESRPAEQLNPLRDPFRDLVDHIDVGVYRLSACNGKRFLYANPSIARMFGYESAEEVMSLSLSSLYEDRKEADRFVAGVCREGSVKNVELRLKRKNGTPVWTSCAASTVRGLDGNIRWIEGIMEDITERRQSQETLLAGAQFLNALLMESPIPAFAIDGHHRVIHWNRALEDLVGITAEQVLGTDQHWRIFYDQRRPCMVDLLVDSIPTAKGLTHWYKLKYTRSALRGEAYEATDFFPSLGGEGKWLRFTATALKNDRGEVVGAMETLEDITHLKTCEKALQESEKKYIELSTTDDLTRLYNSRHFFKQLNLEIRRAKRYHNPLALLVLDIDNFKQLNDTHGHMEGDRVLRRIGGLIGENVRGTDTAYRYGGEEFAVILPETTGSEAVPVAERIRRGIESERFVCEGNEVRVTASIGIAEHRPHETPTDLFKKADKSMYAAKKLRKNCTFFQESAVAPCFEPDRNEPSRRLSP